jgi:hypothetical protein
MTKKPEEEAILRHLSHSQRKIALLHEEKANEALSSFQNSCEISCGLSRSEKVSFNKICQNETEFRLSEGV